MVMVVVIAGNEEDRKGEGRVATQFHPAIWWSTTLSR